MAGPHWRFGTFSFMLYSQRVIEGQVEVAKLNDYILSNSHAF